MSESRRKQGDLLETDGNGVNSVMLWFAYDERCKSRKRVDDRWNAHFRSEVSDATARLEEFLDIRISPAYATLLKDTDI